MSGPSMDRRDLLAGLAGSGLAAGALAGCAAPQPFMINLADAPLPPPAPPGGTTVSTGRDLVGRITAKVMVQGRGPYDFVVDTGANRTVVSTELADELRLPDAGMARVHGIVGAENTRTVVVDALRIDSMAARIPQAPVLPADRLGAAGLLGVDAMVGRKVTLDFRRRQMRMSPSGGGDGRPSTLDMRRQNTGSLSGRTVRTDGVVAQARYRFGQLVIVGAEASGRKIMAFLDSGSQSTVGNLALLDRLNKTGGDILGPPITTSLFSATGQTATGRYAVLPQLRLGGLRIAGLGAVFAGLHVFELWDLVKQPSILIGIDVMRQFDAIDLDYGARRIVFYPDPARDRRMPG